MSFEKWYADKRHLSEDTARAAYEAGRESLLGALLELAEETKDLHDASFWSDATQEVIDSLTSQEGQG